MRFDLPVMAASAAGLLFMASDGVLTRFEGALLVVAAIVFTLAVIRLTRRESRAARAAFAKEYGAQPPRHATRDLAADLGGLISGIVVIVVGAGWLVDGAVSMARAFDVSEAFIGLTIVAIGTSSPELVTTIIGTLRNNRDIAIGNLLGSSIYNILLILGVTGLVPASGLQLEPDLVAVDIPVMTAIAFICVPVFLSGRRITRLEGGLFVAGYTAYLTYLVVSRT